LSDRDQDIWATLFAVADAAGGSWPERARAAALALSHRDVGDDNIRVMLLADLQDPVERRADDSCEYIPTSDLIAHLGALEDRPWCAWGKKEERITPRGLARLLKPLGAKPDVRREKGADTTFRGYVLAELADAVLRYLEPRDRNKRSADGTPKGQRNGANLSLFGQLGGSVTDATEQREGVGGGEGIGTDEDHPERGTGEPIT
jgi:hypothetical protein